ncbi:MAG: ParB/RepB/Spo0J family partition protein [Clostridiales bacterium]|nr:ParB/RepB/Spo0J family partition protein [Clostridiales bacterium]
MARQTGLGRGLNTLFGENSVEDLTRSTQTIKLNEIEPNKDQPRKTFDEKSLAELAESIAKHGVLQPLLVRPMPDGSYQLVAGERRWRAARIAELTEVPVVIKELDDVQTMEIALIAHRQRAALRPSEEAEALQALIDKCAMTQENVALSIGRSRPAIANALRLLKLPPEIREWAREGKLSAGHARALLAFPDEESMLAMAAAILEDESITVRDIERIAKRQSTAAKAQSSRPSRRDSFYDEVELALSESLGRKIKVSNGKKKGVLEIEFYDMDDLKNLANRLQ